MPAWLDAIVGNWRLGGILTLESGLPVTPNAGRDTTNIGTGAGNRPNLVGDPNLPSDERTVDRWFRTEAFAQPPPFTFGDAGRNIVQGPGIINIDLSLAKRIPVGTARESRVPGRGVQRRQPSDLRLCPTSTCRTPPTAASRAPASTAGRSSWRCASRSEA